MAIFLKPQKIFLLILLVLVSFVLSAVKFIFGGGKESQAQAQCWTAPASAPTTSSGGGCSSGTSSSSSSSGCSSGGSSCAGCGNGGCGAGY